MKAAASFSSFSRRPVITTCAPSSTKRLAVAKPIPLLPPVITAIFPANFCPMLLLICCPLVDRTLRAPNNRMERRRASLSDLRQAAVDGKLAAGHEAAVRRREKGSSRPELRRIAHALEPSHRAVGLQARLPQRFRREFGRYRPGRQHVYAQCPSGPPPR